ncbi:glycosyltransferase family 2 protein, partial [Bifidobacterium adolescentis]
MNSNASSDIQTIVTDVLNSRPYTHRQDVDMSVAAVITAQHDLRFLASTVGAVLAQRMLPGMIVIADCTGQIEQPMQMTFDVIHSSQDVLTEVPEAKTVRVILVGVKQAASFMDAVTRAMDQIGIDAGIRALWTLHDDSRPADDRCFETLLDAWRNTPTAALLGAKQLDWQAKNLHNVGLYAGHHDVVSLVVDGEPDQEQYDGRQDVLSVSLSGALVPLATLRAFEGADPWFGTFAESTDLCRRICLGGGRVVVVPQARIAHRRARFEGIRSKNGRPVEDEDGRIDPYLAVREANAKYAYTDMHRSWWPLLWLWSIIQSLGLAVLCLARKQPYHACCELAMPWRALLRLRGAWRAHARLRRQSKVTLKSLSTLSANHRQVREWLDRRRALRDQRDVVLLSPLEKDHLRKRLLRRWGLAFGAALIAGIWIVVLYWDVLRSVCSGASMYSAQLLPTGASFTQLLHTATTSWSYASGTGISAPNAPWLLVLALASVLTGGHVAGAVGLMFFLAAPLTVFSFWALAGIFTRSDAVRCVVALAWFALALSMGLYDDADVTMLTVMVFLPAAFAFSFRAVGMYRTEDLVNPHASVQAAAVAALCFIPVVAAQPQLLLPLMLTFLGFLLFVRSHKPALLLIPLPAAFVCAPTLVNAVRFASDGTWRQLFGSVMLPSSAHDGKPVVANLSDLLLRVFGIGADGGAWRYVAVSILALIVLLAAVSLVLPFVLRVSRMMWVAVFAGLATALLSAAIAVAVDVDGPVSGSMLPGTTYAMMGLLA